jgi:hypothetical protein
MLGSPPDENQFGSRHFVTLAEKEQHPITTSVSELILMREAPAFPNMLSKSVRFGTVHDNMVSIFRFHAANSTGRKQVHVSIAAMNLNSKRVGGKLPTENFQLRLNIGLPNKVPQRSLPIRIGSRRTLIFHLLDLHSQSIRASNREYSIVFMSPRDAVIVLVWR